MYKVTNSRTIPKPNRSQMSALDLLLEGTKKVPGALGSLALNIPKGIADLAKAAFGTDSVDTPGPSTLDTGHQMLVQPFEDFGSRVNRLVHGQGRKDLESFAEDPSQNFISDLTIPLTALGIRGTALKKVAPKLGKVGKAVVAADKALVKNPVLKVTKPIRTRTNEYLDQQKSVLKAQEILGTAQSHVSSLKKGIYGSKWVQKNLRKMSPNELEMLVPLLRGEVSLTKDAAVSSKFSTVVENYRKLDRLEQDRLLKELSTKSATYSRGLVPKEDAPGMALSKEWNKQNEVRSPVTKASHIVDTEKRFSALQKRLDEANASNITQDTLNELLSKYDEADRNTVLSSMDYAYSRGKLPGKGIDPELYRHYSTLRDTEILPKKVNKLGKAINILRGRNIENAMRLRKYGAQAEKMGIAPQELEKMGIDASFVRDFPQGSGARSTRLPGRISLPNLRARRAKHFNYEENPQVVLPRTLVEQGVQRITRKTAERIDKTLGRELPEGMPTTQVRVGKNSMEGYVDPANNRTYVRYPHKLTIPEMAEEGANLDTYLPKDVAKFLMRRNNQMFDGHEVLSKVKKYAYDLPTDVWRAATLGMSPRWVVNNVIGNQTMNALAGVGPISYAKALPYLLANTKRLKNIPGIKQLSKLRPGVGKRGKLASVYTDSTEASRYKSASKRGKATAAQISALKEFEGELQKLTPEQRQTFEQVYKYIDLDADNLPKVKSETGSYVDPVVKRAVASRRDPLFKNLIALRKKAKVDKLLPENIQTIEEVTTGTRQIPTPYTIKKFSPSYTTGATEVTKDPLASLIPEDKLTLYKVLRDYPTELPIVEKTGNRATRHSYKILKQRVLEEMNKEVGKSKFEHEERAPIKVEPKPGQSGDMYPFRWRKSTKYDIKHLFPSTPKTRQTSMTKWRKGEGDEIREYKTKAAPAIFSENVEPQISLFSPRHGVSKEAREYLDFVIKEQEKIEGGAKRLQTEGYPGKGPSYEVLRKIQELGSQLLENVRANNYRKQDKAGNWIDVEGKVLGKDIHKNAINMILNSIKEDFKRTGKVIPKDWEHLIRSNKSMLKHWIDTKTGKLTEYGLASLERTSPEWHGKYPDVNPPITKEMVGGETITPPVENELNWYNKEEPFTTVKKHTVQDTPSPENMAKVQTMLESQLAENQVAKPKMKQIKGRKGLTRNEVRKALEGAPYHYESALTNQRLSSAIKSLPGIARWGAKGIKNVTDILSKPLTEINKSAEDWSRIAHYIRKRDQGLGTKKSLKSVNKWLFNYGGNKSTNIRTFIPFWTWQKNMMKLVAKMPFEDPLKVAVMNRIGNYGAGGDIAQQMEEPEWRQGLIPTPLKDTDDRQLSLRARNFLPFSDIANYSSMADLASSFNPLLKIPAERITKYNLLTKRPFTNPYPVYEEGKQTNYAPPLATHVMSQFPQYQLYKNLTEPYSKYDTGEPMLSPRGIPYFWKDPNLEWARYFGVSLMPRDVKAEQTKSNKQIQRVNTMQRTYQKRLQKWDLRGTGQ